MTMARAALGILSVLLLVDAAHAAAPAAPAVVVDDFARPERWTAHPADGVTLSLAGDQGALRLDFSIPGGGYAIARRELDLPLPADYVFSFRIRGDARPNHLEFKLVDASGENVWWHVKRDFAFTADWQTIRIKKRQLDFAWGPRGGGELRRAAAIEFAVTAGQGGAGRVWIDDLALRALPPQSAPAPAPRARASSGSHPERVLDADAATAWSPLAGDAAPWLELDLGRDREFSGITLDWQPGRGAAAYRVDARLEGQDWTPLVAVAEGNGGRDRLFLPESEARYLRLRPAAAGAPPVLRGILVHPLSWAGTWNEFYKVLATEAPRGSYPRGMRGEQSYWTVVGADADSRESLVGEEGMVETATRSPSLEPFLWTGERLLTWADVALAQSLAAGGLPIPSVTWTASEAGLRLTITAFPVGEAGGSGIVLLYRLENRSRQHRRPTLFVALRPFQVNPPTQFLGRPGGYGPVGVLAIGEDEVTADGEAVVRLLSPPAAAGVLAFDQGAIVDDYLRQGRIPSRRAVTDPKAAAAGALAYPCALEPGAAVEFVLALPLHAGMPLPPAGTDPVPWAHAALGEARESWASRLHGLDLRLPPSASRLVETFRAQLGYVLVNRAGPAIQPGARAYARSWIRDGALTASALLRAGMPGPAKDFCEWYAPYQYENGKIPCVVDQRGADPVPEHDSSGEFIFLVAECVRFSGDREFARRHWPRVLAAAGYLDALRHERLAGRWREPMRREFYGLLPPSISHEGYAAKPMHSYWDDLWALRGFRDAAWLAAALGEEAAASRWRAVAAAFAADLRASVLAVQERHGIDYMPGCADLADFDPTSTTIALSPVQAGEALPAAAVRRSFERFLDFFRDRRDGRGDWEVYTPYEIRSVGACVRLGWRAEAHELLDFYLGDQRPAGWRHWAEVVGREPRQARFLGDMPHTWVGSDFLRSVLEMLLYHDEERDALVLAAGVRAAWLAEGPVGAGPLPVRGGALSFTLGETPAGLLIEVAGACAMPRGGIVLAPPAVAEYRAATVGDRILERLPHGEFVLRELPARVLLRR
ncbi:MAG: discoidin domain-containing protein [Candidatus Krumholzibacteriota bacterium]|nr:discoidin domain-containing protein [Candidatus Krumholzibacteriota bacterium]